MTLKKFITIVSLYCVALILCIFSLKPFANMLKTPVDINNVSDWSTFKSGTRVKGDINIVWDCYFRKTAGNYVAGSLEAQPNDSSRGYLLTNGDFVEDNTDYEIKQYLTYTASKKYYGTLDAMIGEVDAWQKETNIEPVSYEEFLTTTFHVDGYLVKISSKEKDSAIKYLTNQGMATYDAEKAVCPYKIKQVKLWVPAVFLVIALICIVVATLLIVIKKKVVENGITLPGERRPAYKDDFDIKDTEDIFRTPAPSFAKKSSTPKTASPLAKKSTPKAEKPKNTVESKTEPIVVPRSPVMKSIMEEEKEEKEAALEQAKEEELARYLVGNDGGVVLDAEDEEDTYVVPSLEEYAKEYKEVGGETIGANIFKQAQKSATANFAPVADTAAVASSLGAVTAANTTSAFTSAGTFSSAGSFQSAGSFSTGSSSSSSNNYGFGNTKKSSPTPAPAPSSKETYGSALLGAPPKRLANYDDDEPLPTKKLANYDEDVETTFIDTPVSLAEIEADNPYVVNSAHSSDEKSNFGSALLKKDGVPLFSSSTPAYPVEETSPYEINDTSFTSNASSSIAPSGFSANMGESHSGYSYNSSAATGGGTYGTNNYGSSIKGFSAFKPGLKPGGVSAPKAGNESAAAKAAREDYGSSLYNKSKNASAGVSGDIYGTSLFSSAMGATYMPPKRKDEEDDGFSTKKSYGIGKKKVDEEE